MCSKLSSLLRVALIAALALVAHADQLRAITAAQKSSRGALLSLSTDQLRTFIETSSRSFSLFVLFTADPQICRPCAPMRQAVSAIAQEYEKLPPRKQAKHPVFFAEVKLSQQDQSFLASYGINHVPILYRIPKGGQRFPRTLEDNSPDNYPAQQAGLSANAMRRFVNLLVESDLHVVRGGYSVPFVQTVRALMPVIAFVVAIAAAVALATGAYRYPMLWFGIVVLIYIFSVGGGHYSWIHNTPLFIVNNNGVREFIAGGSRSQYVAEGFLVSATCVGISASVIAIQLMPQFITNKSLQTMLGLSMVSLTMIAIGALLTLYHFKMPQYLQYSEM